MWHKIYMQESGLLCTPACSCNYPNSQACSRYGSGDTAGWRKIHFSDFDKISGSSVDADVLSKRKGWRGIKKAERKIMVKHKNIFDCWCKSIGDMFLTHFCVVHMLIHILSVTSRGLHGLCAHPF